MPMPSRNQNGDYRYGYQGEYAEKEDVGSTNSFELRLWDARIGRWMSPDPYSQYFSPYLGMGNNPINGVDPDGGCVKGIDKEGNGIPCPDMKVGSTTVGIAGHTWTMQEDGWAMSDADFNQYGVDLGKMYIIKDPEGGYFGQTVFWMKPWEDETKFYQKRDEANRRLVAMNWFTIESIVTATSVASGANGITPQSIAPKRFNPTFIRNNIGTMSNSQVRTWYNEQLKTLNTQLSPTRANAIKLHNQRNGLKAHARLLMKDRNAAKALDKNYPLKSFEYYEQKYMNQGYSGEALWQRIIQGSGTPNAAVNQRFGL